MTVEEKVRNYLGKITAAGDLNCFLYIDADEAMKRAKIIDEKIASGKAGRLAGKIIAVKDVLSLKGIPMTCSSKILENFHPVYTATAIQRLIDEDAVIIGKTNCDEFAMGSSNENSAYGIVRNPHNREYVPGGSSGGSAAAVAAGLCDIAIGTDTGGSIRQPASFCGVYGLKPTYSLVSRFGLTAFASSFDTVGPLATTLEDIALMMNVIAGYDAKDSTSSNRSLPDYSASLDADASTIRIGLPKEYLSEGLQKEIGQKIDETVEKLRAKKIEIRSVSLPHTEFAIAAYYILITAEASTNLARYDGARYGKRSAVSIDLKDMYLNSRSEFLGSEVKRRIMLGTYVLSSGYYDAYYRKAQKVRRIIKNDFDRVFSEVDVLLTPSTPTTAYRIGEKITDPLEMYLGDIYTISANLAGIPGLNVPAGFDDKGLPIGLQLMAKEFNECGLLTIGKEING